MRQDSVGNSAGFVCRCGLFLARFCASAWIGAASLFVVVGITEVTRGGFDSTTKDQLVAIRFPAFYLFGATLVGIAWVGTCLAGSSAQLPARRRMVVVCLLTITLVVMAVDYFGVYLPLLQMVSPPGRTKTSEFELYHQASKWINLASLLICLMGTVLLNWPTNPSIRYIPGVSRSPAE